MRYIESKKRHCKGQKWSVAYKFAVEGVWGYCGIYASKIHKNLYIYASQSKNWILIETERKNYIVSPENLDMIDVINKWYYLQFSGYWSTVQNFV